MLAEVAQNLLNRLSSDYKPSKWPASAVAVAINDLLSEPDSAAQMAYDEIIRRNNRLPTIDTVIKAVQFHGGQIRSEESREREEQSRKDRQNFPDHIPASTEYGRAALALIGSWSKEQGMGRVVPVRERLKAMARIADQFQREELAETVMKEWAALPVEG